MEITTNQKISTKGSPNLTLIGCAIGFFVGTTTISLFGPAASLLREQLLLNPLQTGLLVSVPALSGSLLRIPFGAWVDRDGGRRPFLTLLLIALAGMLGLILTASHIDIWNDRTIFSLLAMFGILAGAGIATFSVGIAQLTYWNSYRSLGAMLSAYGGVGTMAPGVCALVLPVFLFHFPIHKVYTVWTMVLALAILIYSIFGKNAPYFQIRRLGFADDVCRTEARAAGEDIFPSSKSSQSMKNSAKITTTWTLSLGYFTTFGIFLGLISVLPLYWINTFGLNTVYATFLAGCFGIISPLSRIIAGNFCDIADSRKIGLAAMAVTVAAAAAMAFATELSESLLAAVVLGIAMGVSNAAIFAQLPQRIPDSLGGAAGWIGAAGIFGAFLFPLYWGAMLHFMGESAGAATGFLSIAILALSCLVFIIARWRQK